MNARRLYRIAAAIFVLFAARPHTQVRGFKPPTPAAAAVRDAMANVHFQVGHASFSYGGFYVGFRLYVTAHLLFSVYLS
jgi:hypothetical protein